MINNHGSWQAVDAGGEWKASEKQHTSQGGFTQYEMGFTWINNFPICPFHFLKNLSCIPKCQWQTFLRTKPVFKPVRVTKAWNAGVRNAYFGPNLFQWWDWFIIKEYRAVRRWSSPSSSVNTDEDEASLCFSWQHSIPLYSQAETHAAEITFVWGRKPTPSFLAFNSNQDSP